MYLVANVTENIVLHCDIFITSHILLLAEHLAISKFAFKLKLTTGIIVIRASIIYVMNYFL